MDLSGGLTRYLKLSNELLTRGQIVLIQCESEGDVTSICEQGAVFKSKGGPEGTMHLCTDTSTLACKYVETTNSLMLVKSEESQQDEASKSSRADSSLTNRDPNDSGLLSQLQSDVLAENVDPVLVHAQTNFVVETVKTSIPDQEMNEILGNHHITLDNLQDALDGKKGMTWLELQHRVMACDVDIVAALKSAGALAVPHCGSFRWCAVSEGLHSYALEHTLLTCIENGFSLASIPWPALLESLCDAPESNQMAAADGCLVWHILRTYAEAEERKAAHALLVRSSGEAEPEVFPGGTRLQLNRSEVARGCLHAVLSRRCSAAGADPGSGALHVALAAVLEEWEDLFPDLHHWDSGGVGGTQQEEGQPQSKRSLLVPACRGLLVRLDAHHDPGDFSQPMGVLFESHLPRVAKDRFQVLFRVVESWTRDQIEPYLSSMHDSECGNTSELLLKYTRMVRNGEKETTYVSR